MSGIKKLDMDCAKLVTNVRLCVQSNENKGGDRVYINIHMFSVLYWSIVKFATNIIGGQIVLISLKI